MRLFLTAIDKLEARDTAHTLEATALAMGGDVGAIKDGIKALKG